MCARTFYEDENVDLTFTPIGEFEKKRSDENDQCENSRHFAVVMSELFLGEGIKLAANAAHVVFVSLR